MIAHHGRLLAFGMRSGEIMQYAYTVADVHKSILSYTKLFGIGPWFCRGPFTPPHALYRGRNTGLTLTLARAFSGHTMIELIQQHDDGPSVYRDLRLSGYGFHHWAIAVDDIVDASARLAARGYPVVFEDVLPTQARVRYADASADLPGMIELVEMTNAQERHYASFYEASIDWDGSHPIRNG